MSERAAYLPSPVPSDRDLLPGQPPFTAFGQFGAGHLDLRVFDQQDWWVDAVGRPWRLEEMSVGYRAAVIGHLREHCPRYHEAVATNRMFDLAAEVLHGRPGAQMLAAEPGEPAVAQRDPQAWLESTPLTRPLRILP